jgi:DNA-binding protein YbaB
MKTLIRTIDEMKTQLKDMSVEIKDLRVDMSKGKGAIMLLIILGGIIGTIISIVKFWR